MTDKHRGFKGHKYSLVEKAQTFGMTDSMSAFRYLVQISWRTATGSSPKSIAGIVSTFCPRDMG